MFRNRLLNFESPSMVSRLIYPYFKVKLSPLLFNAIHAEQIYRRYTPLG